MVLNWWRLKTDVLFADHQIMTRVNVIAGTFTQRKMKGWQLSIISGIEIIEIIIIKSKKKNGETVHEAASQSKQPCNPLLGGATS